MKNDNLVAGTTFVKYCGRNKKTVDIPDGITAIGPDAFRDCVSVHRINLPKGLKKIGANAFKNSGLMEINLPDSVVQIEANAFDGCRSLAKVRLPDNLMTVPKGCFASCGLEHLRLPEKLGSVEDAAFFGCKKLKQVEILASIHKIGSSAFAGCSALKDVCFPETFMSGDPFISGDAFNGTPWMDEKARDGHPVVVNGILLKVRVSQKSLDVGGSIRVLAPWSLSDADVETIYIPGTVETVGESACCANGRVKHVFVQQGVKEIRKCAFFHCRNLSDIKLPESCLDIGSEAFVGCSAGLVVTPTFATIAIDAFDAECKAIRRADLDAYQKDHNNKEENVCMRDW